MRTRPAWKWSRRSRRGGTSRKRARAWLGVGLA
jgi:hypothetical protein